MKKFRMPGNGKDPCIFTKRVPILWAKRSYIFVCTSQYIILKE